MKLSKTVKMALSFGMAFQVSAQAFAQKSADVPDSSSSMMNCPLTENNRLALELTLASAREELADLRRNSSMTMTGSTAAAIVIGGMALKSGSAAAASSLLAVAGMTQGLGFINLKVDQALIGEYEAVLNGLNEMLVSSGRSTHGNGCVAAVHSAKSARQTLVEINNLEILINETAASLTYAIESTSGREAVVVLTGAGLFTIAVGSLSAFGSGAGASMASATILSLGGILVSTGQGVRAAMGSMNKDKAQAILVSLKSSLIELDQKKQGLKLALELEEKYQ